MAEELENKPVENTEEFTQEDKQNNKAMAILAYFGILVLIPIFAAKESKFARFHANQGLALCICEAAWMIINYIMTMILIHTWSLGLITLWGFINWLIWVAFLVFAIIGIVNAAQGSTKPMAIFGKMKILK